MQSFNAWMDDFHNKHRGLKPPKKWFENVENSHSEIRNRLGGINKIIPVQLDEIQIPIDFSEIKEEITKLAYLIPGYFIQYKFEFGKLCVPLIPSGDFQGMRWGKHIQTWMKKDGLKTQENVDASKVNNVLSTLGEKWSRCKTEKNSLEVCISTDPKAFASLGYYGPDRDSCFKQKGQNQLHKYILGQFKNSYVVLVGKSIDPDIAKNDNVVSRLWGIANDDMSVWNVCNVYSQPRFPEGSIHQAIEKAFSTIIGVKKAKKASGKLKIAPVYQNKVINWSLFDPKIEFNPQVFDVPTGNGLEKLKYCKNCKDLFGQDHELNVADITYYLCDNCLYIAKKCEYSGSLTLNPLISAYDKNEKPIWISSNLVSLNVFAHCSVTNCYFLTENLKPLNELAYISEMAIRAYNYKKCPNCDFYCQNLHEICNKKVCPNCYAMISKEQNESIKCFDAISRIEY